MPTVIFELFFALRSLYTFVKKNVKKEVLGTLRLGRYYEWFSPYVMHWITLGRDNARKVKNKGGLGDLYRPFSPLLFSHLLISPCLAPTSCITDFSPWHSSVDQPKH